VIDFALFFNKFISNTSSSLDKGDIIAKTQKCADNVIVNCENFDTEFCI